MTDSSFATSPSLKSLVRPVWKLLTLDHARFLYAQRISGFSVPTLPHFDSQETTEHFTRHLRACGSYLEFGSGGSTYLAAKLGKPFITIDSDRYFLQAVKDRLASDRLLDPSRQTFIHADIGHTTRWGEPWFGALKSADRKRLFAQYSCTPAQARLGAPPRLVLVDGRFRVACALKAICALGNQGPLTLLVDDYADRPEYSAIELAATRTRLVGKMAEFSARADIGQGELDALVATHELDWR